MALRTKTSTLDVMRLEVSEAKDGTWLGNELMTEWLKKWKLRADDNNRADCRNSLQRMCCQNANSRVSPQTDVDKRLVPCRVGGQKIPQSIWAMLRGEGVSRDSGYLITSAKYPEKYRRWWEVPPSKMENVTMDETKKRETLKNYHEVLERHGFRYFGKDKDDYVYWNKDRFTGDKVHVSVGKGVSWKYKEAGREVFSGGSVETLDEYLRDKHESLEENQKRLDRLPDFIETMKAKDNSNKEATMQKTVKKEVSDSISFDPATRVVTLDSGEEIKYEKGTPIPPRYRKSKNVEGVSYYKVLDGMKIGEEYFVKTKNVEESKKVARFVTIAIANYKKRNPNKNFVYRTRFKSEHGEEGIRIWRTKVDVD